MAIKRPARPGGKIKIVRVGRILVMSFKSGPGDHRGIVSAKGGWRYRQTEAIFCCNVSKLCKNIFICRDAASNN